MLLPHHLLGLALFVSPFFLQGLVVFFKVGVLFEAWVIVLDFFYAHFMDYGLRISRVFLSVFFSSLR